MSTGVFTLAAHSVVRMSLDALHMYLSYSLMHSKHTTRHASNEDPNQKQDIQTYLATSPINPLLNACYANIQGCSRIPNK